MTTEAMEDADRERWLLNGHAHVLDGAGSASQGIRCDGLGREDAGADAGEFA